MDDRLDALLARIDDAELRDALRREIARTRDPMPVWVAEIGGKLDRLLDTRRKADAAHLADAVSLEEDRNAFVVTDPRRHVYEGENVRPFSLLDRVDAGIGLYDNAPLHVVRGGSALHAGIAAALMQCAGVHSAYVHSESDPFGALRCVVHVRPDERDERAQEIAELLVSVVPAGIALVGGVERAVGAEGYAVARWDWAD